MTADHTEERVDGNKISNLPIPWQGESTYKNGGYTRKAKKKGPFESLGETDDFFEKDDVLDLLGRGSPGHIDAEEV